MSDPEPRRPQVEELSVGGLDGRIRVIRCGHVVDVFVVFSRRFVLVVDTLISPGMAAEAMALLELKPHVAHDKVLLVANTHGDWDHSWGNGLFDGPSSEFPASIIGHISTRRRFDPREAREFLNQMRTQNPGWYDDVELRLPTIEFDGELMIDGGDLTFRFMPTPGHTPDHVAIWIPEIQVLLAGDAVEMPMPFMGPESDVGQMRATLRGMLDLDPVMVLACHGNNIWTSDLIRHNMWYFDEAERRCRQALYAGLTRGEITPETLAWPLESTMPPGSYVDELADADFYRKSHAAALRAMAAWVQEQSSGTPGGTRTHGL